MIIEKITGLYFDEYLQMIVFDVCGMKSTGYYERDRLHVKCKNREDLWNENRCDSGDVSKGQK